MKPFVFYRTLLIGIIAFSVNAADMAILESPQSFSIYSQFEQPLSASDKAGFSPYAPLQIIKTDALLGDGITRAMECLYQQKTYYLLKDERGGIIGDKGRMKLLKGCALIGDTVEIVKGNAVAFSEKSFTFSAKSGTSIPKGGRLIVLFKYGNAFYSLQTAPMERFGWIAASSSDAWKHIKQAAAVIDSSITEALHAQIAAHIASANALYKTFFDRFNGNVGSQKSVPMWSEMRGRAEYVWILSEPYGHTGELDESAEYLIKDLQDILIGKPYSVRYEKGRIIISSKALVMP
jgi:hypothetical protein